jgi:hypothetical protein
MKSIFRSTKKTLLIGVAFELLIAGTVRAQCVGYAGPGGPCSTGPGGGLSTGPGGGLSNGPNPWRRVPAPRYLGEDGSDDDSDDE